MKQYSLFIIFITAIFFGCSRSESETPVELIGNYYDKEGKDFWIYSLQKNFVIYNCKFWDVKKVQNKKGSTKIVIKNENSKRRLLITTISNNEFKFRDNENSNTYSTIANPDVRKAKDSFFSMQPGKVKIFGFIKNSTKYVESNPRIRFLYNDFITEETYSVYAPIDSLGRFQLEMELLSAQDIMYQFDNKLYSAFVSPNDTLMIYFDPESPDNTYFQGNNSDINYDLLNSKGRRFELDSPRENNNQLSKHFNEYKTYKDSVRKREIHFLNEYSKNEYCSEIFKIWYKKNSEIRYYTDILNYNWKNYYSKDVDNSKKAFNAFLDTFFGEINMNDSVAPITGMYFFYTNAISNKIPRDRKSFFTMINNELTIDERKTKFSEVYISKIVTIINKMEEGRLKDILFAKLVSEEISNRKIDNIDKTFNIVEDQIQYKPYLTHLSNFVASFKKKEAEFENNPVTFRKSNSNGERLFKKIITDNKDKVIILDFWFTGCGPCRQGFKKIGAFKKDLYVEADVEFVYLCFNSTEKDWKYVSKEYNLQGQNYLLTQEQIMYFQDLFSISAVPRYILINKAGKIVNSNFSLPMDKNQFMLEIKNAI